MSKFWYSRGHRASAINMTLDHEQILFTDKQTDDLQQNLKMTT